ncbi:MAG: hypothetical protein VX777_06595 [Chlamydiota bacterium]|nr:hypothetical protein [Chlamydiota bacterium]
MYYRTIGVHFKEYSCQVHDSRAAANLSVLRKIALSLLKQIDPKNTYPAAVGYPDYLVQKI